MKKRTIVILLKCLPILASVISFICLKLPDDYTIVRVMIKITVIISFFGFIFFFIGKKMSKNDKLIKMLSIFDLLSTLYIIILYIIVIFSFGL